jgi:Flp pilus assembly protein TadG
VFGRGDGPIEYAIIALPMLIVTFAVIQASMVFYARMIAQAAAVQGADSARYYQASTSASRLRALAFISDIGPGLSDPQVTQTTTATSVTVTVRGRVVTFVPGWTITVSERATGPIERTTR